MRDMGVDKLFQSLLIYSDADLTEVYVELRLSSFQVFLDSSAVHQDAVLCVQRMSIWGLTQFPAVCVFNSICSFNCYQVHSTLYFCGYFFSFMYAFYYLTLSKVSRDVLYVNLTCVLLDGWLTLIASCPVQLLSQSWNKILLQICARRGPKQPICFCTLCLPAYVHMDIHLDSCVHDNSGKLTGYPC